MTDPSLGAEASRLGSSMGWVRLPGQALPISGAPFPFGKCKWKPLHGWRCWKGPGPEQAFGKCPYPFPFPTPCWGGGAQLKSGAYSDDRLSPHRGGPKTPSAGTGMQSWSGRSPCLHSALPQCPPLFSLQGRAGGGASRVQINADRALSRTRLHAMGSSP